MNSRLKDSAINAAAEPSSETSNPEVVAVKRRRLISPSEKRRILLAYDRCKLPGERGALLRTERVYSSMLTGWRKQLGRLDQAALTVRRGPKPSPVIAQRRREEPLIRENARLQHQLDRANAIIDVQKKLCVLLGLPTAEEQESKDR
jgi:transposase